MVDLVRSFLERSYRAWITEEPEQQFEKTDRFNNGIVLLHRTFLDWIVSFHRRISKPPWSRMLSSNTLHHCHLPLEISNQNHNDLVWKVVD